MSNWTLETRNGKLYACEHSKSWVEPVWVHSFHLVEKRPNQWILARVGEPLEYDRGWWRLGMMGSAMIIRPLAVYPEFSETDPIKAPGRGGKDWKWEWQFGEWKKRWL